MKIAIVGSREWKNLQAVRDFVDVLPHSSTVISGGARGVDKAAEDRARERKMLVRSILPNWDLHGKAAGMIRNSQIVAECDALVAFWDGESRGTKNSIDKAKASGKPVIIFTPEMDLCYSNLVEVFWEINQLL